MVEKLKLVTCIYRL